MDQVLRSRVDVHILLDSLGLGLIERTTAEVLIQESEGKSDGEIQDELQDGPVDVELHHGKQSLAQVFVPLHCEVRVDAFVVEVDPGNAALTQVAVVDQQEDACVGELHCEDCDGNFGGLLGLGVITHVLDQHDDDQSQSEVNQDHQLTCCEVEQLGEVIVLLQVSAHQILKSVISARTILSPPFEISRDFH